MTQSKRESAVCLVVYGNSFDEVARILGLSKGYLYNDKSKNKQEWARLTAHFQDYLIAQYEDLIARCALKRHSPESDPHKLAEISKACCEQLAKLYKKRFL